MPSSAVRAKQNLRRRDPGPKIIVRQPRNLSVPVKISIIKSKNRIASLRQPTVNFFKTVHFLNRSKKYVELPSRKCGTSFCRWFRRKRALKKLANERKKEEQTKFEQERLEDFIRWERLRPKESPIHYEKQKKKSFFKKSFKYKKHLKEKPITCEKTKDKTFFEKKFKYKQPKEKQEKYKPPRPPIPKIYEPDPTLKSTQSPALEKHQQNYSHPIYQLPYKYETLPVEKKYKGSVVVARNCGGTCPSEKPAKVKKKSRSVYVKKYNKRVTITEKFVNCFYRCCCQFYCYLTCIIIIMCIIIYYI